MLTIAQQLEDIAAKVAGKTAYVLIKLGTEEIFRRNSTSRFRSASLIKLPILWTYLSAVSEGIVDPAMVIELSKDVIVPGTGKLKNMEAGTKLSLAEKYQLRP